MKIGVRILPRKEVLDTQGRAVEATLRSHGQRLHGCQVGRFVVLDLPVEDSREAMAKAKEMAELVLYNPLIETYELEAL